MSSYTEQIQQLNQWYLLALRDAASRNLSKACLDFHAHQEFVQHLLDMPYPDVLRAAKTREVLFKPAVSGAVLRDLASVEDPCAQGLYCLLSPDPI